MCCVNHIIFVYKWPRARIAQVHPGSDDTTRVFELRSPYGPFTCPAINVYPLAILPPNSLFTNKSSVNCRNFFLKALECTKRWAIFFCINDYIVANWFEGGLLWGQWEGGSVSAYSDVFASHYVYKLKRYLLPIFLQFKIFPHK